MRRDADLRWPAKSSSDVCSQSAWHDAQATNEVREMAERQRGRPPRYAARVSRAGKPSGLARCFALFDKATASQGKQSRAVNTQGGAHGVAGAAARRPRSLVQIKAVPDGRRLLRMALPVLVSGPRRRCGRREARAQWAQLRGGPCSRTQAYMRLPNSGQSVRATQHHGRYCVEVGDGHHLLVCLPHLCYSVQKLYIL